MTAVEWLEERFERHLDWEEGKRGAKLYTLEDFAKDFEKAKEMHKQEIIDAFLGHDSDTDENIEVAEEYYEETFKQD